MLGPNILKDVVIATIANYYRQSAVTVRQYGRLSMATAWLLVFTVFKQSHSVYDASKKYKILISLSSVRCVHSRCQKFHKFPRATWGAYDAP